MRRRKEKIGTLQQAMLYVAATRHREQAMVPASAVPTMYSANGQPTWRIDEVA